MELAKWKEALRKAGKRENLGKLACLLGGCGVLLLCLPSWLGGGEAAPDPEPAASCGWEDYRQQLEEDLSRVVGAITGESEPVVLVTLEDTGENVYATDQARTVQEGAQPSSEEQSTHTLVKDGDGAQHALPITQRQPEVQGAVVVSARAADPAVREQLTQAVCTALHVSSARVLVVGGC